MIVPSEDAQENDLNFDGKHRWVLYMLRCIYLHCSELHGPERRICTLKSAFRFCSMTMRRCHLAHCKRLIWMGLS
jgi:hypothetical protein